MKKIILSVILATVLLLTGCSGAANNGINPDDIEPNQVIEFPDPEFERMIRKIVGKEEGDIIASDMATVYSVNINYEEYPVTDITGLEYAVNLNDFSYRNGEGLKSLDPIAYNQTMEYLTISYSTVNGKIPKFNTPALDRVNFGDTNISNFDFLKDVTTITELYIGSCNLESLDFIKNMNDLERLHLDYNKISDITPVANKTKLISISLHKNEVSNISALESCVSLETVNLSYNHVNNVEYLFDLENLYDLTVYEELDQKLVPRTQIEALIESGVSVSYHE